MRRVAPFSHPRYEPGDELGRGAQGVVVRVVDREAPALALCAKVWQDARFREEALLGEFALLARARIPGLARAHDLARCARTGAPFLVEDFVDGPEGAAWVNAEGLGGAARGGRLAQLLAEIAGTLALLHDAGFVHGDLKPAHVRVAAAQAGAPPRAVLLDLGAAMALARADSPSGGSALRAPAGFTPAFAAPEIAAGGEPSPLSDLYGAGALAWTIATGRPPGGDRRPPLRTLAPWVAPGIADVIEGLLAAHPRDRPPDARELLRRLGVAQHAAGIAAAHPPAPIGRERELAALLAPSPHRVRYLVGPSGAGKSHLARELATRALLAGRSARLVRFPSGAGPILAGLIAFLRGSEVALPFVEAERDAPLLLILDDLHLAPAELRAALDLHRCRPGEGAGPRVDLIATAREAPDGAEAVELRPLDDESFAALCRAVGIGDPARVAEARAASGKSPGWLVASAGCIPLTRDTALGRARALSAEAATLLGAIATAGGEVTEALCRRLAASGPLAELCAASLVDRRSDGARTVYALTAPALARELASALGSFALTDRVADALLADPDASVAALLAAADAPSPPARRADLLDRAAARARAEGRSAEEIEALSGLAADPARRSADRLLRLERLVRDAGVATAHPQVLDWLDEAARGDARVLPLALRRRAEKLARDGDAEGARALAEEARSAAAGDPAAAALALGTIGLCALYRAAYGEADRALGEARARLAAVEVHDPEEIARVDHNLGVVALYRGKNEEAIRAFERSLSIKRSLGDRAGMRSCLLNLGLALAKTSRLDDAARALDEALGLARALGQTAGRGWVLAALADVAVRRGDAAAADRRIGEAAALEQGLPAAVRADLAILRAQVALLEGDGPRALTAIGALDAEARTGDALTDARALAIEAAAHLATLPVDRRRAARLAVTAIRRAREAGLPEAEAQATAALRAARRAPARQGVWGGGSWGSGPYGTAAGDPQRSPPNVTRALGYAAPMTAPAPNPPERRDEALWRWLGDLAGGAPREASAAALARLLAEAHGAERAFVAAVDPDGGASEAWGADLDGLPVAEARARVPRDLARAALGREGPIYQRDVATPGGRGARLAVAAPGTGADARALIVLEHRFAPGAFDRITAEDAARWATLAGLIFRVDPAANATFEPEDEHPLPLPSPLPLPLPLPRDRKPPPDLTTAFPVLEARRSFPGVVGRSPALSRALARLDAAVDSELPVLISGETGSGKEVFVRALHEGGPRRGKTLVAVNCGAIPDALFEAELFGHARGSFTGAERARPGLIARAEKGTLFLDEIGELPLLRQAGLLRALQERRYRPVGSDEELPFDVRIVAATNRDLERAVAERAFRQDLLYRLNAIAIRIPPLRERAEDIPELARTFLSRAGSRASLSPEVLAALEAHPWPGNVRELEHLMQRLSLVQAAEIGLEHLPRQLRAGPAPIVTDERARSRQRDAAGERDEVERALAGAGGNISRAAARLGLTRQGLKKRMVRLGMRAPKEKVG
jgi:transcriptional regulator with AAA-type ATPase domain/tetratricopeptide (TPR) repeat protein